MAETMELAGRCGAIAGRTEHMSSKQVVGCTPVGMASVDCGLRCVGPDQRQTFTRRVPEVKGLGWVLFWAHSIVAARKVGIDRRINVPRWRTVLAL